MKGSLLDPTFPHTDGGPPPPLRQQNRPFPPGTVDPAEQDGILPPGYPSFIAQHLGYGYERKKTPFLQYRTGAPQLSHPAVPAQQLRILLAPRITAPVERISVAFHPRLISIIDTGDSRQGVLYGHGQLHQLHGHAGAVPPSNAAVPASPCRACLQAHRPARSMHVRYRGC